MMRDLTLSHRLPPLPSPNPLRWSLSSSLNSNSCLVSKRRSFCAGFGYARLFLSRCPGQWREKSSQLWCHCVKSDVANSQDPPFTEEMRCLATKTRDTSYCSSSSIRHNSRVARNSFLEFTTLVGLLAFQGSEPAFALTNLASGLQSAIPSFGDFGDISTGFASAFLLIFFSELGDKTFFIAALLAARNSAAIVFTGTFGALAAMTIVSVVLGRTFHYVDEILPFRVGGTDLPVDDIAAVCLLVYFGVSTLIDASSNEGLKADEEQKEAELAVSEFSGNGAGLLAAASTVISTFALVFVAEWGDKSFFSTIALAAASSPLGVIGGALAGHGVATLLAVLGGSLLGNFLSEKAIAYVGGVLFLVFAAVTLAEIVS